MNPLLKAWHALEFAAAWLVLALTPLAPLPLVLAVAGGAGRLAFLFSGRRRRIAIDNLLRSGLCRDQAQARRLALAAFQAFTTMIAEAVVARRRLTRANWSRHVTLRLSPEAEEIVRAPGLGVIVASAHIGNWEVAARAVSMIKPVCVVYRPFNNPYLNRYVHRARSGERLRLVSRLERDPMRFLRALADGEIVALMIDQHVLDGRVAVEFFGRKAWTTKSVAMMQLTTHAPLLVACAIRTGPLRYEVHAIGPIQCEPSGDREKDAFEITQAMTREIEKAVRRWPDQYLWGHRRWRDSVP